MKKEKKQKLLTYLFSFIILILMLFYIYLGFTRIYDLFSLFGYVFFIICFNFILKLIENNFIETNIILVKLYLKIKNILFNIIGFISLFLLIYIILSYTSYNNFISLNIYYNFKIDYIIVHLFISIFFLVFSFLIASNSLKKLKDKEDFYEKI